VLGHDGSGRFNSKWPIAFFKKRPTIAGDIAE
jgi:hypothetical protein